MPHSHRCMTARSLACALCVTLFSIARPNVCAATAPAAPAGKGVTLDSPNGKITIVVAVDAQEQLTWSVHREGKTVLTPAPLGLIVDGKDLGQKITLGDAKRRSFQEEYPTFGNHSKAVSNYNEALIPVQHAAVTYELALRAFDDGAAVRYSVPLQGSHKITRDNTAWGLPAEATAWWSAYGYENPGKTGAINQIPEQSPLSPPIAVALGNDIYLSISEANNADFPDMGLVRQGPRLVANFPASQTGWTQDGPIVSPWRTAVIAQGLTALVNSDLLTNLCPPPPPELAKADWIKPGRSLWQWYSIGAPKLDDQHAWVDAAKKLHFEYYLIDDGWRNWRATGKDQWQCLKDVVDYGKTQGVASLVWVDSKEVLSVTNRRAYLEKVAALGAAGIKIDFIPPATPEIMKWYEETLKETAELHLLCNFHGAVKPTGRQRTWPHALTREGIRGLEYHMTRYRRVMAPEHDESILFTRFLAGPADYTPTAFDPTQLVGYTPAHMLAQSVDMTSPLLHFADNFKFYIGNPAENILREVPSTWDETIVLPGSKIGEVAGLARRRDTVWYIGVLNGAKAATLPIDLKFLGTGDWQASIFGDDPANDTVFKQESRTVKSSDTLNVQLRIKGGYVAQLKRTGAL
jgi:alpha-glucosidase